MIAVMISLTDHPEGRDKTMRSSNYFEINYSNSKIKFLSNSKANLNGLSRSWNVLSVKQTNKQKEKCQVENGAGLH